MAVTARLLQRRMRLSSGTARPWDVEPRRWFSAVLKISRWVFLKATWAVEPGGRCESRRRSASDLVNVSRLRQKPELVCRTSEDKLLR